MGSFYFTCVYCKYVFLVAPVAVLKEMKRLLKLEKAINILHFELATNQLIGKLTANDEKLDTLFCELEALMNFDKIHYQDDTV